MTAWLLTGNSKRPGIINDVVADSAAVRPSLPVIPMTCGGRALTAKTSESAGIRELLLELWSLHTVGTAVREAHSVQPQS